MMFFKAKGSITIFLCITMPIIIILCAVLVDIYLLKSGKNIVTNQVDIACYSILGEYSSYLKNQYDLYAYEIDDYLLKPMIMELIEKNLADLTIYDLTIEEISISKENPLIRTDILSSQITKIMSDSIYKTIINETYNRLSSITSIDETLQVIKDKWQFDEVVKEINDNLKYLKMIVEGEEQEVFVNILGTNSDLNQALQEFMSIYHKIIEINNTIAILESQADEGIYKVELLLQDKGYLKEQLVTIYKLSINKILSELLTINNQAITKVTEIVLSIDKLHLLSKVLERKIESINQCPDYLKEILIYVNDILYDVESAIVIETFELVRGKIEENVISLTTTISLTESLYEKILDEQILTEDEYVSMDFLYHSDVSIGVYSLLEAGKGEDKRSFFEKIGEQVITEQVGEDIKIPEGIYLPSNQISDFEKPFDIDVSGDSTDDADNKLEQAKGLFSTLITRVKEETYLNEYILQYFIHQTSKEEIAFSHYFNNEVEYILYGRRSQHMNMTLTKSTLLLARFALNTIHVYADIEKQIKANTIATMVAGWWTFGAGIPVMANLMLCAWAVAEAGLDVKALSNGEYVPIYKLTGDWRLDIGLNKIGSQTPKVLQINYEDYLRILLYEKNEEDKLLRILDLISLNSLPNFDLSQAYTTISIKVTVSQKSLLGKRHVYTIKTTQSY